MVRHGFMFPDVVLDKYFRIILDEIHSIGQQEGGAVWQQIICSANGGYVRLMPSDSNLLWS